MGATVRRRFNPYNAVAHNETKSTMSNSARPSMRPSGHPSTHTAAPPGPDAESSGGVIAVTRALQVLEAFALGESSLSLAELNRLFLRRGWFTPVTPGTQYVTLGGMVAADVHGKNHHVDGCFGQHVTRLRMRVPDGRVVWSSRDEHPDLMNRYLTDGSRSIPIVIALDPEFQEIGHWGPRPRELQQWVMEELRRGRPKSEIYPEIRKWYARDRGETTLREVLEAAGRDIETSDKRQATRDK